jgi:SNF2 family DNA or RNA helicase
MSDLITKDLARRYQLPVLQIDGRTPVPERQLLVDHFHAYRMPAAMVLNPRAAGVGLNITAANHVIHYNLEWNPSVEDQATARAHRRGAERPVTVYRLFHASTVEEVINDRLNYKRSLFERTVVGHDGRKDDSYDIFRALSMSPLIERNAG